MKKKIFLLLSASISVLLFTAGNGLAQQTSGTTDPASKTEVDALKRRIDELENQNQTILKQNQEMLKALADLKSKLDGPPRATKAVDTTTAAGDGAALATKSGINNTLHSNSTTADNNSSGQSNTTAANSTSNATVASNASKSSATPQEEDAPLALRLGRATIVPIGFADFTTVFRTTNTGNGLQTNFGSVPFSTSNAAQLTEIRPSAQNSRFGFRVDTDVEGAHVTGYLEGDFLGVTTTNLTTTANGNGLRMRQYYVDVRKGKLEILGGQAWSMLTPNRKGISPELRDLYYGERNLDPNEQLGLTWARDPQVRFVYHATDLVTLGLSLENPDQYIGGSNGGGLVTLPAALSTALTTQLDNGSNSIAVPNVHPDIIEKIAFDPTISGHSMHFEVAGVERTFRIFDPVTQVAHSTAGAGASFNFGIDLTGKIHFLMTNYFSEGGGRYIFGQAPDVIVRPDGSLGLIRSASNITGIEYQVTKNTSISGYYGIVYVGRDVITDANNKLIGYGFAGAPSANNNNRVIQEPTVDILHVLWRDPKYGTLQTGFEYSYVGRTLWAQVPGVGVGAHTNMIYVNLRFILPGSAPPTKY